MGQTTETIVVKSKDESKRGFASAKNSVVGLEKAAAKAQKVVGLLAGGAALAKLGTLAKRSIDAADAVDKLSKRTGASAEFLSEMKFALSQNDATMTDFGNTLRKINKSSQDAADGLSTPIRAFEKLGISVDAFNNLNSDEKFVTLSEAIAKVEDPAVRTQTAMDIMGKAGERLLPTMVDGAAGIAKYREEAHRMGLTMSGEQVAGAAAANDAIDKLGATMSGIFMQSVLEGSDEIEAFAAFMADVLPPVLRVVMGALTALGKVLKFTFGFISDVAHGLGLMTESVIDNSAVMSELTSKTGEQLQAQQSSISARIEEIEADDSLRGARGRLVESAQLEVDQLRQKLPLVASVLANTKVGIRLAIEEAQANIESARALQVQSRARIEAIRWEGAQRGAKQALSNATINLDSAEKDLAAQQQRLADFDKKLTDAHDELTSAFIDNEDASIDNVGGIKKLEESTNDLTEALSDVIDEAKEITNIFGDFEDAASELDSILLDNAKSTFRLSELQEELNRRFHDGEISGESYQQGLESIGVSTEDLVVINENAAEDTAILWGQTYEELQGTLGGFISTAASDWDGFTDNFADNFKDMAFDMVAAWLASGIMGYLSGEGISGFTMDAFLGGSGNFSGSGGNNNGSLVDAGANYVLGENGASYVSAAGSAYSAYDSYQSGDYLGAALSTYSTGATLGLWGGATTATGAGIATTAATTTAATTAATAAATTAATTAATSAGVTAGVTAGASAGASAGAAAGTTAASGAGSAALTATGYGAIIVAAIALLSGNSRSEAQILNDEFRQSTGNDDAGFSALGENGGVGFDGGNIGVFGLSGGDNGLESNGSGFTAQHFIDGAGVFSGAAASLKEFEMIAASEGYKTFRDGGQLKILGATTDQMSQMWETYAGGLDESVLASEIFETAINDNLIIPSNLFFEQFAIGFGESAVEAQDSLIRMDTAFDGFVASGMDKNKALFQAISDNYGIAIEDAQFFVEQSGVSADQWVENFTNASDASLIELLDFNEKGITAFESMTSAASTEAASLYNAYNQSTGNIGESFYQLDQETQIYYQSMVEGSISSSAMIRASLEGSVDGVDLGAPKSIKVETVQVSASSGAYLGAYNTGGDFIVPGTGNNDQPYRIDLTPGERVTIEPKGANKKLSNSSKKSSGSNSGVDYEKVNAALLAKMDKLVGAVENMIIEKTF